MRDLTDEPADVVTAERARVATEGWGARLLALQAPDGQWGGRTYFPEGLATTPTLSLLRNMGLDPQGDEARRAIALVRENSCWEHAGQPFFEGEVEPCINGMAVAIEPTSLENVYEGELHFAIDGGEGAPSLWNTLRALRVLRWYEDGRA